MKNEDLTSSFLKHFEDGFGISPKLINQYGTVIFDNCPWDYEKIKGLARIFWVSKGFGFKETGIGTDPDGKTLVLEAEKAQAFYSIIVVHSENKLLVGVMKV